MWCKPEFKKQKAIYAEALVSTRRDIPQRIPPGKHNAKGWGNLQQR